MEDATDYLNARLTYERIALERRQFAVKRETEPRVLESLDRAQWRQFESFERDTMITELMEYILAYEGGTTATDWVVAELAVRPRWFPKFLWRRMPTRRVRWEIEATPEWIWPFATVRLPESLGRPGEFMVTKTTKTEE